MMIESVSISATVPPVSNTLTQQSVSEAVLPDEGDKKQAAATTGREQSSMAVTGKSDQNVERVSEIVDAVQESMDMIKEQTTHLRFSVHEQTDQVMVKITNPDSGEVIREIPSQEFLDLAAKFEKMVGLMFDMKI